MDLRELYNNAENNECLGCKILNFNKPFHCWKEYKDFGEVDVLFINECMSYNGFEKQVISEQEEDIFNELILPHLYGISWTIAAAVKCPKVGNNDMAAKDMDICRKYVVETVQTAKPKLIITMGNLAFKMLLKKSGIAKHHGSAFEYEGIPVVPTYNIRNLFVEPRYRESYTNDIKLAISKFIRKTIKPLNLDWKIIESYDELDKIVQDNSLKNTFSPIAVDIESTGLNFLVDEPLTVAIAWRNKSNLPRFDGDTDIATNKVICIPIFHKESKISKEEFPNTIALLKAILENPNNKKILCNSKFDYKFLKKIGITISNIWDVATMAHLIDEFQSISLRNMMKKYFPESAVTL